MSALPRPDLPPGPARALNEALHDLHHRAGWPSLRALAREAGVSHTTVSKVLSAPTLPTWGNLELVVEAMHGDTARFHDLWLAASAPTDRQSSTPRIAGRRAELDVVRRHLEAGRGLLLVTGEAGIGKTTLVTAAASTVDAFVTVGRCLPLAGEASLLPIADGLRSIVTREPEWFARAIATCHPYVRPAVAALVPEVGADVAVRGPDRQVLFAAVRALLARLADGRPLALLVEDLHWADPGTLDLLEHLLSNLSPLPVLGTWRTADLTTPAATTHWLERVSRLRDTSEIALAPMSLAETTEQLSLIAPLGRHDAVRVHERSGGLPLFTEQLAAHGSDGAALPRALADLLDQRLDGLAPRGWTIVTVLALASRALPRSVLEDAVALSPEELTDELRDLTARHLLRSVSGRLELRHALLAEAVSRRVVAGEDTAAHRALAEALSRVADIEPAEVAEHWRGAGDVSQEVSWRIRAARSARARHDRRQEAEQWLRVVEVWPTGADELGVPATSRPEAYLAAIDALRASGQFDRAAAMSDSADEELGEVDELVRAGLLVQSAELRGLREGSQVAAQLIGEALRVYDRHPPSPASLLALDRQMMVLRDLGRYDESRVVLDRAVAVARTLKEAGALRDLLMQRAWVIGRDGDTSGCWKLLDEAAAGQAPGSDPLGDLREAVYLTDVMLTNAVPPPQVLAAARPALDRARAAGIDNLQTTLLRGNLAAAACRGGLPDEAEELLGLPPGAPVALGQWWLHVVRAEIDVTLGDLAASGARLAAIDEGLGGLRDWDLDALLVAAELECWAPRSADVLDVLTSRLEVLAEEAPVRVAARALVMCARLAADALRDEDAPVIADLGTRVGLLGDQPGADVALRTWRAVFEAELARLSGRSAAARWAAAAAGWDELSYPHDAAYARWRGAQCALRDGQGTVARRLLARAAAQARTHVPLSRAIAGTAAQ